MLFTPCLAFSPPPCRAGTVTRRSRSFLFLAMDVAIERIGHHRSTASIPLFAERDSGLGVRGPRAFRGHGDCCADVDWPHRIDETWAGRRSVA